MPRLVNAPGAAVFLILYNLELLDPDFSRRGLHLYPVQPGRQIRKRYLLGGRAGKPQLADLPAVLVRYTEQSRRILFVRIRQREYAICWDWG